MASARSIAVVGGGFGGVGAAVMLRRAGYDDVTVFERGERVGGVWHSNTYPGASCDIPSHLYEFSFAHVTSVPVRMRSATPYRRATASR